MPLRWGDNVVESSTATTTGAYQLAGVPASGERPGAQTFLAGIGNTNTCYYRAEEASGTAWEHGLGTVASGTPNTLTRTRIDGSSNAGAAVDWTGKTVRIYVTLPSYAARRVVLDSPTQLRNATLVASRTGNAETFALKTAAGTDPSATDPVVVGFNNTSGGYSVVEITAALSLTISSGSTLGATSASPFRIWVVLFNDAGTPRLGAIKCALTDGVYGLQDNVPASSTAEGGAGAADSAGVIYTGTAVASKVMRVLGYYEYTLAVAGTWGTAPSAGMLYGPGIRLPGEVVQRRSTAYSALVTTTAAPIIPADTTIPQSNEGTQYMSQALAPTSAANLLMCFVQAFMGLSSSYVITSAIFMGAATDALVALCSYPGGLAPASLSMTSGLVLAGSTAEIIFAWRSGPHTSATYYFNSFDASARLGACPKSTIAVEEIQV